MADRFNSIGKAAKNEGVLFAYHNHGYGFSESKGVVPIHYKRHVMFFEYDQDF